MNIWVVVYLLDKSQRGLSGFIFQNNATIDRQIRNLGIDDSIVKILKRFEKFIAIVRRRLNLYANIDWQERERMDAKLPDLDHLFLVKTIWFIRNVKGTTVQRV